MVLSRSEIRTGKHTNRIENFSRKNEEGIESYMPVHDNKEHDASITSLMGQEMAIDIQYDPPSLVELTLRGREGEIKKYACDSLPPKEQSRLLRTLAGRVMVIDQSLQCNGRRTRQARKYPRKSLQLDSGSAIGIRRRTRRYADSTGSSYGSPTRSDTGDKSDDTPQTNKRKTGRKSSTDSAKTVRESRSKSIKSFPMEDCTGRLKLADETACVVFYRRILMDAQQDLCKKLAKWWIKAINPNKQTNHPYAGGPSKKPDWWPMTPPNDATGKPARGTLDNGFVRHREPDHLSKPERLNLLPHILVQIVDPHKRTQFHAMTTSKLEQISLDSINNESIDKEKHDSWRQFVSEIFRVAKMQERYKNREIDDTTFTSVRISYESWRHRSLGGDIIEYSMSDGNYEEEDEHVRVLTPRTADLSPERHSVSQDQEQSELVGTDIKEDYSCSTYPSRFLAQRPVEPNDQRVFQVPDETQIHMQNQMYYIPSVLSMPRSDQHPNLLSQEPSRRHSDSADSDRFANSGNCLTHLLPNNNVTSVANLPYQDNQTHFHLAALSNGQNGIVLPPPLLSTTARSAVDVSHLSPYLENGYSSRIYTPLPAPPREPILGSSLNMHQLTEQPQGFQEYNQDYGDKGQRVHALNIHKPVRPTYIFDQENLANSTKPEYMYDPK